MTTIIWYYDICPFAGLFFVAIDSTISSYKEVITFSHRLNGIFAFWHTISTPYLNARSHEERGPYAKTLLNEFNQSNQNDYKTMSTSDVLQKNVVDNKTQYWVVSVSLTVFTG